MITYQSSITEFFKFLRLSEIILSTCSFFLSVLFIPNHILLEILDTNRAQLALFFFNCVGFSGLIFIINSYIGFDDDLNNPRYSSKKYYTKPYLREHTALRALRAFKAIAVDSLFKPKK